MPKNLGIIDTFVGYNVSAGTLMAAVDRAIALEILNPSLINITFVFISLKQLDSKKLFRFSWHFDQCDESLSAGYAANLIHDNHVSAILGPTSAESKNFLCVFLIILKSINKQISHFRLFRGRSFSKI